MLTDRHTQNLPAAVRPLQKACYGCFVFWAAVVVFVGCVWAVGAVAAGVWYILAR